MSQRRGEQGAGNQKPAAGPLLGSAATSRLAGPPDGTATYPLGSTDSPALPTATRVRSSRIQNHFSRTAISPTGSIAPRIPDPKVDSAAITKLSGYRSDSYQSRLIMPPFSR